MVPRFSNSILIPFLVFSSLLLGALFGYRMGFFAPAKPEGAGWFYDEVFFQIEENFVDDIELDKYKASGAKGIVEKIPHAEYYSTEEAEKETQSFEGRYEGIGIQFYLLNDTIFVVNTISGGPSEKLGIQSSDRIVGVNGNNVAGIGISQDSIVSLLMGPRNTKVDVTVWRSGKLKEYTIVRGSVPTPSVSLSYMVDREVGYIKVDMFGSNTHQEFTYAIESLQKDGMSKLIVDLRNNGGGYLQQAINMLDECIEDDRLLLYTEGRKRKRNDFYSHRPGVFEDGEIVVLTNTLSASASEIFAGAIQDWDRGYVIGQRTFGKGLVQEEFILSNKDVIRLPVSKYYMPSGRCVQKPYKGKDAEEYDLEILSRYESDEILDSSAIILEDMTKYYTLIEGRTVYGGGGVIPDFFVPIDTSSLPYSRVYLTEQAYYYFSKHRNQIISEWYNAQTDYFENNSWANSTIFSDSSLLEYSSEDRNAMNAFLQNVYASMIWQGPINKIALHKTDKHFIEAKKVLDNYQYSLFGRQVPGENDVKEASLYDSDSMEYSRQYSLKSFWLRMGLIGASLLLLGGLLFSYKSKVVE